MENRKEQFESSQQGSGSAENIGKNRSDQKNPNMKMSDDEKQNIASEIGENPDNVADLQDLGALSGRDDAAGGSGDRMERTNTDDGTNP
jgi:hypothetical protein